MKQVAVGAGETAHDVLICPLDEAAERLRDLACGQSVPTVTDQRVWALHGEQLRRLIDAEPTFVPEGEEAKTWPVLRSVVERLAELGVTRRSPVVAFGGGSVGDVAGLAAAIFKRGCPVVHIPTTLLAQADSAIGGKTAIDAAGQKNLVGAFHFPALVIVDPAFLRTLDPRQLRSGYAEVVKYGLINDPDFFAWCEEHGAALLHDDDDDEAARLHAVSRSVAAKAAVVGADPYERTGVRTLLNLGHSFGHAIEAVGGFDAATHGEAVAAGICLAFDLSVSMGLCPKSDRDRVRQHFAAVGLPCSLRDVALARRGPDLLPLILKDKKAGSNGATLVLTRGIGQAFVARDIEPNLLAGFLARAA